MAFNCNLAHGHAEVTEERVNKFLAEDHSPEAISSFVAYCERVVQRNKQQA
jgi:hypothetical protein